MYLSRFWKLFEDRLELCHKALQLRHERLSHATSDVAPILWQHGAIARLNPDDDVIEAINKKGFTVTLGYSGIYETIKVLTGMSHTTKEGFELAEKIMAHLKRKCEEWKKAHAKWMDSTSPLYNICFSKHNFSN